MSKKAKLKAKEERLKKKRSSKTAMIAKWESFAAAGKNTKSKRVKLKSKAVKPMRPRNHPHGECHNFGCSRCYPKLNSRPQHDTFQHDILSAMYPNSSLL